MNNVKRLLALCIMVPMLLCACGANSGTIEQKLDDTAWKLTIMDGYGYLIYCFEDDRVVVITGVVGVDPVFKEWGDYEVEEDGIISIEWDDPECVKSDELYYSFDNGKLELFADADHDEELKQKDVQPENYEETFGADDHNETKEYDL